MDIYNKKVLLVDDDEPLLTMMYRLFIKEGFVRVNKAKCGEDAVRIAKEVKPDIIVLDIMMPDIDGYEVCERIRKDSMVPILFLSAKKEEEDRLLSFSIGGDDFISKPFSTKELVARVTAMLKRNAYYESRLDECKKEQLVSFERYTFNFNKKSLYYDDIPVELTFIEYKILEYMLLNINVVLSKEQIIERVWGYEYDGDDNTIMVHIRHLREKIEQTPSNPLYIKTVKGRGYMFELAK